MRAALEFLYMFGMHVEGKMLYQEEETEHFLHSGQA